MGILADWQIQNEVRIEPFHTGPCPKGTLSYGTSGYGYDVRLDRKFKIFTNVFGAVVDPKAFDPKAFVEHEGDTCVIPPNSFILGSTIERISVPRDILVICVGKSTYARCGLLVNVTPLEPEWVGHVTIEISNTTPLPVTVYANEGIAQMLFLRADRYDSGCSSVNGGPLQPGRLGTCSVSYADKGGKYQGQAAEVTLPRVST